ncbi:MAG TPA: hypothetical protein VM143_02285 [Acidimicrobiales bacterium]|nr:hypothetical protein [Acidimicrobiales bacterium]
MSLEYAAGHFRDAVVSLAHSEQPTQARLQRAWDDHVQMVWMKRCLNRDLLRDFKALWEAYTAPADDPHSTKLRALTSDEAAMAIAALVDLSIRTAIAGSRPDQECAQLAAVADLA